MHGEFCIFQLYFDCACECVWGKDRQGDKEIGRLTNVVNRTNALLRGVTHETNEHHTASAHSDVSLEEH